MKQNELNAEQKKYFDILRTWDFRNDVTSKGATAFYLTWEHFEDTVWNDEFAKAPDVIMAPYESTLLEGVLKDSAFKFLDDIKTPQKETLADDVTASFKKAVIELKDAESKGRLEWAKYKDTKVTHLTKLDALSRMHLPIGGGTHCINAAKSNHGPSWRMIVSLTPETEAYGVYPGGQSGNPGSKYYDNFIDTWVAGKYYTIWVMKQSEEGINDKKDK